MNAHSEKFFMIDSFLSSKHEIVFIQPSKTRKILLKIKNSFSTTVSENLKILAKNPEAPQYILPITLDEGSFKLIQLIIFSQDFIKEINTFYSTVNYEQMEVRTLRQEIGSKKSLNLKFTEEELIEIYSQVEKSLQFLHQLNIFPSFLTTDTICYIPNQEHKKWILNIQGMFKYAEPNDIDQSQYFSCQLCEEHYEELIKNNKLYKLPMKVFARENYINLGICILQACSLEFDKNEFCSGFHNHNIKIRTINYLQLCSSGLKTVQNTYQSGLLINLIKYLVFAPTKCIKSKEQTFLDYLPFYEQFTNIQDLVNLKLHEQAFVKIKEIQIQWKDKICQQDALKLRILHSQCLYLMKENQEFIEFTSKIVQEMKIKFQEEIDEQEFIIFFKLLYKQFIIRQNEEDNKNYQQILNQILNEVIKFYEIIKNKFSKSKAKALNIKSLQIILQFLMQLFSQLSCKNPNIDHAIEYFNSFTLIASRICLTIINLMKSSEQFQNQIRKYVDFLQEIQNDIEFIARLNFQRTQYESFSDDSLNTQNYEILNESILKEKQKKTKKQVNHKKHQKKVNIENDLHPIQKQIC